jgi:hypothetical protein
LIAAWAPLVVAVLQASLQVHADTAARIEVGDPVVVSVRVHLDRGATLVDAVPRTRDTLATGVRVLSADTLRRQGDDWVGRVRVAFFRPDSQAVPALAVAYRIGNAVDTMVSADIPIVVRHVLPEGNATLRDIREIDTPVVPWWAIAGGVALASVALAALALMRGRRREVTTAVVMMQAPGPLDVALGELAAIEKAGWDAARTAQAAADVVRKYLEVARGVPALERTTPEVQRLVGGDGRLIALLTDVDLVKFARRHPNGAFVERARAVLQELAA